MSPRGCPGRNRTAVLHKASPQIMQRDQWGASAPFLTPHFHPFSFPGLELTPSQCAASGKCGTSCLGLSLLWEHQEAFGCPSTCSGRCENETPSHKVQQFLSEAGAATAAIAPKHQLQQHTQSMGCNRATAKSRSPPLLVSSPLKELIHAFTSFSLLISIG